ncbi:MAG: hypothetical protein U0271_29965 [Polyangiaceae bacterium]
MRSLLACAVLALIGCAREAAPCEVSFPRRAPPTSAAQLVPLTTFGGESVPTTTAWVGDAQLRVVLDTGANMHLLGAGVSFYLGLPEAKLDGGDVPATDVVGAHGEQADGLQFLEPLELSLDLVGLSSVQPMLKGDALWFESLGVAGFVSPQRLVPEDATLVIEPERGVVRVVRGDERAAAFAGAMDLVAVCPSSDGVPLFAADLTIAGAPARLFVDTGADITVVGEGSEVDRALANEPSNKVLSQSIDIRAEGREVADQPVRFGTFETKAKVRVSPIKSRGTCAVSGSLGYNFLRRCSLVVDRRRAGLRCPG